MSTPTGRPMDWLEYSSRAIRARYPEIQENARYVAERLSALLLERLPRDLAGDLVKLLPKPGSVTLRTLQASAGAEAEPSIGYSSFVERALHSIGSISLFEHLQDLSEERFLELAMNVADNFLWSFAQELPDEYQRRIAKGLPMELRSRMNLPGVREARAA